MVSGGLLAGYYWSISWLIHGQLMVDGGLLAGYWWLMSWLMMVVRWLLVVNKLVNDD